MDAFGRIKIYREKNWVDTLLQKIFGFDFFTLGYIQILICYCQTQPQLQL